MELKDQYALVMAEEGEILRVRRKEGMKVGNCIYVLEEDFVRHEETDTISKVLNLSEKKKNRRHSYPLWKQAMAAVAALVIFMTSAVILLKPETAYAMVSVDGNKNVEVLINQKHTVKEAESGNDKMAKVELEDLKGKKVDAVKDYFEEDTEKKETLVVGYALCKDATTQEVEDLHRQLEKIFGTEHVLYICGNQEDIKQAKKEGKSLGMYLVEHIVSEKEFGDIVYEGTEEEFWELLESNHAVMQNPTIKQNIQKALSEYKEDESNNTENESDLQEEVEDERQDRLEEEAELREDRQEDAAERESSKKEELMEQEPAEREEDEIEFEEPDVEESQDDENEMEEEED